MSKYAYYNSTSGEILGLYDNSITQNIPVPNTSITDSQWLSISSQTSDMFLVDIPTLEIISNPNPNIQNYIETQQSIVQGQFDELINNSTLNTSLNYTLPVSRNILQNLQMLQTFMTTNNITTAPFQLADGSIANFTYSEITTIINEIIEYGLNNYQNLWTVQNQINNSTSITEIIGITLQ